ncbi:DUF4178 domain-containing protein [Marinactinospora rubrisoli]|uniref:DUF4178 domain-containing protein n=1 Tax=Marinactinospora rubrisoli TaxID=2715399 RepID=A0ABW2KG96_9ACTN
MFTLVLLLVIAALVAVVAYLILRSRRAARPAPIDAAPRDPFADVGESSGDPLALKAGDMLEFGVERTWIRGTLRLSDGGATWAEHFMEVEGDRRWLSVEEDPDLRMVLWTARPELDLTPDSMTIDLDGVSYRLTERGSARYRSEGTTGLAEQGRMEYADYEGPDGRYLAFERFDQGRWEPSLGVTSRPGDFTIFPAS